MVNHSSLKGSAVRRGSLFPYSFVAISSALICLSALRHRLYADPRGQTLHIFRVPGRCFSAIRVDRSTLQSVSSSEDDRGISRHCFGMVCFALSTYAESRFICRISTIPRHRTNFQGIAHRGRCIGCFPFAVLCQTEYIVIQRVRLRGGREIQSLRLPRLQGIQMFWGASVAGADTYHSALWHQPLTDSPRHTLAHTAKNLLPRRVRSDGSRTLRQGGILATQALKR